MKANIDNFKATVADISPEDMPAVQEERSNFRNTMKSLWTKIQQQYGYRSNYDLLKAAKDEIDIELGEYTPHIRKSIRKDLEQKYRQAAEQQNCRKRRDEQERWILANRACFYIWSILCSLYLFLILKL